MEGTEDILPGFVDVKEKVDDDAADDLPKIKKNKRGGGFQSMGLSYNVLKGVVRKGYKIPTPIQRKTIPLVLEGKDVVAMARTGSGKTACFLIPMFEKLKQRTAKSGARALILSPTRELAIQTLKFVKDLGRFLDLKSSVILGGDSMDDQFAALHGNPDIIVATPGRFLHVCMEMDLKLNSIDYVVFDEADRLFEMGLGEQLSEITARLPDSKQTVLFSATLPKVLVEFAKAGLSDPVLIRLDVESKLPSELELFFFGVRQQEKLAGLIVLLKYYISQKEQTIIFAATKHHVEYIHMVLNTIGIHNTYIYSNLDPSARKINAAKFSSGKVKVLIVTDIAARGIDIPQLDNVINYNFPEKSKLFVHRVGRCARAGRYGKAYSLITPDEYAHLLDLHLFLGRPFKICTPGAKDGIFGRMPQEILEEQHASLKALHDIHSDLLNSRTVSENGYQQYMRSRPAASVDSNRRVKDLPFQSCSVHPFFKESVNGLEEEKESVLDKMKSYRPCGTIFEICGKTKSKEYLVMKEKRTNHKEKIVEHKMHKEKYLSNLNSTEGSVSNLQQSNQEEITETFPEVIVPSKRRLKSFSKRPKKPRIDPNYISHVPMDRHTEEGLAVNKFQNEASKAEFDLIGDSGDAMQSSKQMKKWDRKKKKMVGVESKRAGKIRTESGVWIPATYKSERYAQWKEKTKSGDDDIQDDADEKGAFKHRPNTHWARHNDKIKLKERKSELKSKHDILKARKIAAKNKHKNMRRGKKKRKQRN